MQNKRMGQIILREPTIENKYNLTFSDIKKLKVKNRSKIGEPLLKRNDIIDAWCVSETTAKTKDDVNFGSYNDYFIAIDDDHNATENKVKVCCSSYGGMCGYEFNTFFDESEIENAYDLEIQEKLLAKVNELIDIGILEI